MSREVGVEGFHHVEFLVGNARRAAWWWQRAMGFDLVAYAGPETGLDDRASYALVQGNARVVVTSPMRHDSGLGALHLLHGDTVRDICFTVRSADEAFETLVARGAPVVSPPRDVEDGEGAVRVATVRAYGDVQHTLLEKKDRAGVFLPGWTPRPSAGEGAGILCVDHVVGNVEDRQMDRWADWYIETFGFRQFVSYDDKDISTDYTALRSRVVASRDLAVKMPINEPAKGLKRSQIQEYIDFHVTAGVQHVALLTGDIVATVGLLRSRGVEFLEVPGTYYESVWDRVGDVEEDREAIRDLEILVDRDDEGYLLQTFTRPLQDRPTFFLEIIQRRGCQSFGKGNFKALFESIEREQARRGNL